MTLEGLLGSCRKRCVIHNSGRRDIATTSTNKAWNGSQLQSVRDRYSRVRSNVQRKRTRSARRLMRTLSGRERRFQRHINHVISKELVTEAKNLGAALAFEDLTKSLESLNSKPRNKTERRRSNNWAFYVRFVSLKIEGFTARSVQVARVPATRTG